MCQLTPGLQTVGQTLIAQGWLPIQLPVAACSHAAHDELQTLLCRADSVSSLPRPSGCCHCHAMEGVIHSHTASLQLPCYLPGNAKALKAATGSTGIALPPGLVSEHQRQLYAGAADMR